MKWTFWIPHKFGPFEAIVCFWSLSLAALPLHAQDEDDELPEEPSAPERELTEDDQAEEIIPTAAPGELPGQAESSANPLWETYDSETSASIAQEVTNGVRVEDIVEPPSEFRFAAFGKPDPFVAPMAAREDSSAAGIAGVDPLEIPIVSPLQRYSLAELKVVGVWELATGERKAMIIAGGAGQTAQGIIVKAGDPVGSRGGKVLSIGTDFLTIREFTLAPDGTRQYEDQQMHMDGGIPAEPMGRIRFEPGKKDTQVIMENAEGAVVRPPQELGLGVGLPVMRRQGAMNSGGGQISSTLGANQFDTQPPTPVTQNLTPPTAFVPPPAGPKAQAGGAVPITGAQPANTGAAAMPVQIPPFGNQGQLADPAPVPVPVPVQGGPAPLGGG